MRIKRLRKEWRYSERSILGIPIWNCQYTWVLLLHLETNYQVKERFLWDFSKNVSSDRRMTFTICMKLQRFDLHKSYILAKGRVTIHLEFANEAIYWMMIEEHLLPKLAAQGKFEFFETCWILARLGTQRKICLGDDIQANIVKSFLHKFNSL